MSLELRLLAYQGGGTRGDRIVRASFRGKYHPCCISIRIEGLFSYHKLCVNIHSTYKNCSKEKYLCLASPLKFKHQESISTFEKVLVVVCKLV